MSTNNNGSTPSYKIITLSQSERDAYQVPDGYVLEDPLQYASITASNQNSFEYVLVKKEEKPAPNKPTK